MKAIEKKITSNKVVEEFIAIVDKASYSDFALAGGAIIDILNDEEPKDYDFIEAGLYMINKFIEAGYKYQYTTKSSTTYKKGDITVQFINTPLNAFDFKISQSRFRFRDSKLIIDRESFENKTLIPIDFESERNAMNSLRRIPHWEKKGYTINDLTYLSLLNAISKHRNLNS